MPDPIRNLGLFVRYARLWREARRHVRLASKTVSRHASELERLRKDKDREIRRQGELIAALQTKIELVQRESVDRIFEMQKLIGSSYILRDTDDRIQSLRYQPFDEARRDEKAKQGIYHTLDADHQNAYDAEYESHVQRGTANGLDRATIDRVWRQHEGEIVATITG